VKRTDEGSFEIGAAVILAFIVAVFAASSFSFSSGAVYTSRNRADIEGRGGVRKLGEQLLEELQPLSAYLYDDRNNAVLEGMRERYAGNHLEITDASSGYNLNFLDDGTLKMKALSRWLFPDGNAASFLAWRKANGMTTDSAKWNPFLNAEARSSVVSFGYLNLSLGEKEAYKAVASAFRASGEKANEQLFPLVNTLPLINVNMVDSAMLAPLITGGAYDIPGAKRRFAKLQSRLSSGPLLASDITSILGIPRDSVLMAWLGVKTSFWRLSFHLGNYRETLYAAAIPSPPGSATVISEYVPVDFRIWRTEP
jgi:hypothetical protein